MHGLQGATEAAGINNRMGSNDHNAYTLLRQLIKPYAMKDKNKKSKKSIMRERERINAILNWLFSTPNFKG